MPADRQVISVGIDIGTTTTQVVFSQLNLADTARAGQAPRIELTDRKVIYRSPVYFTPLTDSETIDPERLAAIIRGEFSKAGIGPRQVETGAVIITGETAKKKNADRILQSIADLAGDFVCTVAGPHVESMISGRGSGAAAYSREHFTTVSNVDIGGGSANLAIFKLGSLTASAAMNFGGRMVILDPASGKITHLAVPAQIILNHLNLNLQVGDIPSLADLARLTAVMADLTVELIEGGRSALAEKLYLTPPTPVSGKGRTLMFSGGVGYYFYHPIPIQTVKDLSIHGDIGPLLAYSLRQHPAVREYPLVEPAETLHATVLGASSQHITLSGSTIWAEEGLLPLKNIPVIRTDLSGNSLAPQSVAGAIVQSLQRWDVETIMEPFAVALDLDRALDYALLVQLAAGLHAFSLNLPPRQPLIVILRQDYARAVGQTLKGLMGSRPLLVIDQVGLEEGDYIDIGAPMMDGRVVPVSVKTLIFYH